MGWFDEVRWPVFMFEKGMLQIKVAIHVWSFLSTTSASKRSSVDDRFLFDKFFCDIIIIFSIFFAERAQTSCKPKWIQTQTTHENHKNNHHKIIKKRYPAPKTIIICLPNWGVFPFLSW